MTKQVLSEDRQDDLCESIAREFKREASDFFYSTWSTISGFSRGIDPDRLEDKIADAIAEKVADRLAKKEENK